MIRTRLALLSLPFFAAWRLVALPTTLLLYGAHGPAWLLVPLALLLTFGLEIWARRHLPRGGQGRQNPTDRRRRGLLTVILGLLWLGLVPEEGVIATVIWAAMGAAWASATLGWRTAWNGWAWIAAAIGALLGLASALGPGSWLTALCLVPLFWLRADSTDGQDGDR